MERKPLRNDKILGLTLIGGSWGIAILSAAYFYTIQGPIPVAVLAWPATGVLFGLLLILSDLLESQFNLEDEIDELPASVADSWRGLVRGRINRVHSYLFTTAAAVVAQFYLILHFQKWIARWGRVNVFVAALLVVIAAWAFIFSAAWFQNRGARLSREVFLIPAFGWLVCAGIGVYFAEPDLAGLSRSQSREVLESNLYWSNTRGADLEIFNIFSDGLSFELDCDEDGCLILILIIVTVLCISASAAIPHFWLVATLLLLTIMAGIALRELLYDEKQAVRSG